MRSFAPELCEGVRFYILGLAPSAARVIIRFWYENDFGTLVDKYQQFLREMHIEPTDRCPNIPLWQYLCETAVLGKTANITPNLAAAWMQSILTGTHYPYTLFSSILMRIHADKQINARRASILKAVLIRNFNMKEAPVSFDPDNMDKGYLLGRLFAVFERIQEESLGKGVNASIKDKFYNAASAQPQRIFATLQRNSVAHLSKIGKEKRGYRTKLEKQIGEILDKLSPSDNPFPLSLSMKEQALFALGYYHQHQSFFQKKDEMTPDEKETEE